MVTTDALEMIEELDELVFAAPTQPDDLLQTRHQTEGLLNELKSCLAEDPSFQARLRRISELAAMAFDGDGGGKATDLEARRSCGLLLEIVALKISVQRFMEE